MCEGSIITHGHLVDPTLPAVVKQKSDLTQGDAHQAQDRCSLQTREENIMIQQTSKLVLYDDPTDLQGVQNDRVSLTKKTVLVAKCRSPISGQEPARLVCKHSVRLWIIWENWRYQFWSKNASWGKKRGFRDICNVIFFSNMPSPT